MGAIAFRDHALIKLWWSRRPTRLSGVCHMLRVSRFDPIGSCFIPLGSLRCRLICAAPWRMSPFLRMENLMMRKRVHNHRWRVPESVHMLLCSSSTLRLRSVRPCARPQQLLRHARAARCLPSLFWGERLGRRLLRRTRNPSVATCGVGWGAGWRFKVILQTRQPILHIRGSIVLSISACHAEDPGSIPGREVFWPQCV